MILGPDGQKMSKSRGQRDRADADRRALRRRRGPLLHPVHRARPTRTPPGRTTRWRASHRFLSRLWRLGDELRAARPLARRRSPQQPSIPPGDALTLVRKANWAIDKVTGDIGGRFALQHRDRRGHGAGQRALPLPRRRVRRRGGSRPRPPPRCCSRSRRTSASEVYELLTGRRVWEEPWPAADPAMLVSRHVRARLPGQRQGPRPRDGADRRAPRGARAAGAGRRAACRPHVDGHEVVKVIVVPDKLVNVVRAERRLRSATPRLADADVQARLSDPRRRPRPDRRAPRPAARRSPRRRAAPTGSSCSRATRRRPRTVAGRAERDDVRDRPPVHHRRRRRALEGQGARPPRGRARRRSRPTRRSRSSPARRAASRPRAACTRRSRKAGGDISAEDSGQAVGAAQVGGRAGTRAGPRARRRTPRGRWSRTSASASSGCCASSRSSRSVPSRGRRVRRRTAIEELTAASAERRAWSLADALLSRRRAEPATRRYLALRAQGERLPGLLYWMAQRRAPGPRGRARARRAASRRPRSSAALRMPLAAADRLIADARRDRRRAAASTRSSEIADLELASRGGSGSGASEDTPRCWRSERSLPRREIAATRSLHRRRRLSAERLFGGSAAAHAGGAGLLARAVVAVQRAALDGLVDRLHEHAMLGRRPPSASPSATAVSSRWKYVLIFEV